MFRHTAHKEQARALILSSPMDPLLPPSLSHTPSTPHLVLGLLVGARSQKGQHHLEAALLASEYEGRTAFLMADL